MSSPAEPSLPAGGLALLTTASPEGVETRRRFLKENGPHLLGWSYANAADFVPALRERIRQAGSFSVYLAVREGDAWWVPYRLRATTLSVYPEPRTFLDPVDGKNYLVHALMTVSAVEDLPGPLRLEELRGTDGRRPDPRRLELGFLPVRDRKA